MFILDSLVFRWPQPLFFMVLGGSWYIIYLYFSVPAIWSRGLSESFNLGPNAVVVGAHSCHKNHALRIASSRFFFGGGGGRVGK